MPSWLRFAMSVGYGEAAAGRERKSRSHGVLISTLDSESRNPNSNLFLINALAMSVLWHTMSLSYIRHTQYISLRRAVTSSGWGAVSGFPMTSWLIMEAEVSLWSALWTLNPSLVGIQITIYLAFLTFKRRCSYHNFVFFFNNIGQRCADEIEVCKKKHVLSNCHKISPMYCINGWKMAHVYKFFINKLCIHKCARSFISSFIFTRHW